MENEKYINLLTKRYPVLINASDSIMEAFGILEQCYENDGKLLVAGNGGSAADAEHITGELMKSFKIRRSITRELAQKLISIDCIRGGELANKLEEGLMTIPLVTHLALSTAYLNDVDGSSIYAQQLYGYGREGDVFLGISTSGNSENIINAAVVAKAVGMKVIALTGKSGGELVKMADVTIKVPETETYMVQECHLPIYHCLCLMLEERFFGN